MKSDDKKILHRLAAEKGLEEGYASKVIYLIERFDEAAKELEGFATYVSSLKFNMEDERDREKAEQVSRDFLSFVSLVTAVKSQLDECAVPARDFLQTQHYNKGARN